MGLPRVKINVANSSSQGATKRNVLSDVTSNRLAPRAPPRRLTKNQVLRRGSLRRWMSLRYEKTLAMVPGTRATVLEALAITAGIPANTREGNVRKLPPPATALIAPAAK